MSTVTSASLRDPTHPEDRSNTTLICAGYATKIETIGDNLSIVVGGSERKRPGGYVKAFKNRVTTHDNPHHKVLGCQRKLHAYRVDGTELPCIIGIKMVPKNTRIVGYIRNMVSWEVC